MFKTSLALHRGACILLAASANPSCWLTAMAGQAESQP
jgi:hypothetical protein